MISLNTRKIRIKKEKVYLNFKCVWNIQTHFFMGESMEKIDYISRNYELLNHSIRVSNLSLKVARQLNLNENTCKEVAIAAALHDIGKLKLNQDILYKKEKLSEEEFKHLKTHTDIGYEIVKSFNISNFIKNAIIQHHESLSGTGYPKGLKGGEINKGARILKVCDMFDALTMDRPYRQKYTADKAIAIINNSNECDEAAFIALMEVIAEQRFSNEKILISCRR